MKTRAIGTMLLAAGCAISTVAAAHEDDDGEEQEHACRQYAGGQPPARVEPREAAPATASAFPRESARERSAARQRQLEILLDELATEQQLLAQAERRPADTQALEQHRRNIEALRREIVNAAR